MTALNHITAKESCRTIFYNRFKDYVENGVPSESVPPLNLTRRGETATYVPEVSWRNVAFDKSDDKGQHFLHFSMQNATDRQDTFNGSVANSVGTQHNVRGLVTVEIYFSKSAYQTKDEDRLSFVTKRCFVQRNIESLWFRNSVIIDLEAEENYFRSNVLAEFEYDSVIK